MYLRGSGRFVGLRCNITQYLHVVTHTRTYEGNNVFNGVGQARAIRRAPGTGSGKVKEARGNRTKRDQKKKQVQSQRQRLQKGRQQTWRGRKMPFWPSPWGM